MIASSRTVRFIRAPPSHIHLPVFLLGAGDSWCASMSPSEISEMFLSASNEVKFGFVCFLRRAELRATQSHRGQRQSMAPP